MTADQWHAKAGEMMLQERYALAAKYYRFAANLSLTPEGRATALAQAHEAEVTWVARSKESVPSRTGNPTASSRSSAGEVGVTRGRH